MGTEIDLVEADILPAAAFLLILPQPFTFTHEQQAGDGVISVGLRLVRLLRGAARQVVGVAVIGEGAIVFNHDELLGDVDAVIGVVSGENFVQLAGDEFIAVVIEVGGVVRGGKLLVCQIGIWRC